MIYKISVNNKVYEVEIEDINARPVIARVDGERFEVLPGEAGQAKVREEAGGIKRQVEAEPIHTGPTPASSISPDPASGIKILTVPLPGTVTEVFVKAGDKVEAGQVVAVIEAMKMKNSIRSMFSGTVSEVLVSAGQSVSHKQALIKFRE